MLLEATCRGVAKAQHSNGKGGKLRRKVATTGRRNGSRAIDKEGKAREAGAGACERRYRLQITSVFIYRKITRGRNRWGCREAERR